MNSLLTRGLRKARLRDGGAWPELVTKAIQGQWPLADNESRRIDRWFSDHVVAQEQELVLRAVRESLALEASRG